MRLNSFATAGYTDNSLLKQLGYDSFTSMLFLTTMENVCCKVGVNVLSNLQMVSSDGSKSLVIDLVYAKCN